jgi:5-methylcytosine-specific restriction protein B
MDPKTPLNQILFGPPGTGKTYNTVNKALEIIGENIEGKSRKDIKALFESKVQDGQIVFTTFHQSMSYEDFIEGIKPLKPEMDDKYVKYDVVPGIFKKLCRKSETPINLTFDIAYKKLLADLEKNGEVELNTVKESFKILSSIDGDDLSVKSNSYISNITKEGLAYVSKSQRYAGTWGQFYKAIFQYLSDNYGYKASESKEVKNHVLIIDEINRGNVSQIFGELITLIEEDKRLGKDEALEITLPYSKETFGVPSNLYIIGTMNTADRSVEAIDTALRRRFSFEEVPPKYDLKELQYDFAGVKVFEIIKTLNKRIEKLLDKDHQIGHSYFMMKNGDDVGEMLLTSFYKNIIPLLQEYFFGDFGKIGLVLGQGFVQKKEWNKDSDSFAEFEYESASEFDDRPIYEIIDHRDNDQADDSFVNAIKTLMNKKIE